MGLFCFGMTAWFIELLLTMILQHCWHGFTIKKTNEGNGVKQTVRLKILFCIDLRDKVTLECQLRGEIYDCHI